MRSLTVTAESSRAVSQVRTYWSRGLPWVGKGSFALLDQGLISGSNFLIGILLARWLAPEAYGAFGLAFAIFLLLSLVHQALILEPMSVFGPSHYRDCQREYMGSLLRIEACVALLTVFVLGMAAWVTHEAARSPGLSAALAGMAVAAPCLLLLELTRGAFYVKLAPHAAALGALLYSAVVVIGLRIVYRQGLISPFTAFVVMAFAALAASGFQQFLLRLQPGLSARPVRSFLKNRSIANETLAFDESLSSLFPDGGPGGNPCLTAVTRQHWDYGRWALASSFMAWIPWNIQYILVNSFSSMAGVGELRALLNLTQPLAQGFAAFSLLAQPYAAAVHHSKEGVAGLGRVTRTITLLFAGVAIAYWIFMCALRGPIVLFLYAGKYVGVAPFLAWIALASLFRTVAYGPAIALRAIQSPASVFVAYGVSSAIAVAVGIPAAEAFGLRGAIVSIIVSNSATPLVELILLRRKLSTPLSRS